MLYEQWVGATRSQALPRVIGAEAPEMSFEVVATEGPTTIVFVPDLH